jgi:hypothetical protein
MELTRRGQARLLPRLAAGCASSVVPGQGDNLHDGPKDELRLIDMDVVTGLTGDDEAPPGREL